MPSISIDGPPPRIAWATDSTISLRVSDRKEMISLASEAFGVADRGMKMLALNAPQRTPNHSLSAAVSGDRPADKSRAHPECGWLDGSFSTWRALINSANGDTRNRRQFGVFPRVITTLTVASIPPRSSCQSWLPSQCLHVNSTLDSLAVQWGACCHARTIASGRPLPVCGGACGRRGTGATSRRHPPTRPSC